MTDESVAEAVSGYALVWEDQWLYTAPDVGSLGFRARITPMPEQERAGRAQVVRVIGKRGEFLAVQNIRPREMPGHCHDELEGLWSFELTFYVREADLAPVTTRKIAIDHEDETRMVLSAGVAVTPSGAVSLGPITFTAEIPANALGTHYEPGPLHSTRGDTTHRLRRKVRPLLGGEPVRIETPWKFEREVSDVTPQGSSRLVSLGTSCLDLRMRVSRGDLIKLPKDDDGGGWGGLTNRTYETQIPESTPVYWESGTIAGMTRSSIEDPVLTEHDDLLCLETTLVPETPGTLRLCIDPDALMRDGS